MFRNKILSITVTAIVMVIAVYLLWQFNGSNNLLKTFKNINPIIAILAFFLYILTLVAKAFRYRFILKNKISINKLLSIVSIHSFWNNILPFKSGEITYLYMINEEKNISNGENVISLLLTRVFDVLIILIFLLISVFFIFHNNSKFLESVPLTFVVSILILGVAILLSVIFYRYKLSKFFSNLSFRNSFLAKGSRIISETFLAFNQIRGIRRLSILTILSFSVWILDTLFIWATLFSVGFRFSVIEAAFIGVFPVLAGLIPINLVGNFGAFEGTVTGGLVLLNISIETAFSLSFVLHIQTLLFSSALFIFAFWYRNFLNQSIANSQAKTHTELYLNIDNPGEDFRNNNLADFILGFLKKGNLFDIGAGSGLLMSKASKKNIKVKGLEPDEKLIALSEKFFGKLNINQTFIEKYNSHDKFDNVVMIDVLECIDDYNQALIKSVSFLDKDGRLVLVVPAYSFLFGSRDTIMKYFRRFDKQKFSSELESLGLKIIKTRYWNMLGVLPYWILYKVLRKESHFESIRGGKNKKSIFHKVLGLWFKYIENNINLGFGLSLVFLVEKKHDYM